MIYLLEGEEIKGQFKLKEGVTYPSNWLDLTTIDEKLSIGIIPLEEIYPYLEANQMYDGTYIDDYENLTRTYNIITIGDGI